VWTNLIDNAAAALGGRGRLVLRTRRDGDHAVVEVVDDGPGIRRRSGPDLGAFYTTKPAGEGSGLGPGQRPPHRRARHSGTVEVDTGAAGTTFRVRLPLQRST
jgi:signal transduction histidine kinase